MGRLGMEEGEPIEHNLISRAIENAQHKVEGHNFDIRKQLLEYDDVMNSNARSSTVSAGASWPVTILRKIFSS